MQREERAERACKWDEASVIVYVLLVGDATHELCKEDEASGIAILPMQMSICTDPLYTTWMSYFTGGADVILIANTYLRN